jgi:diketogulonate reductase-like aldo/keto reductase
MNKLKFLYGTAWKEDLTESCVLNALKIGYRGIDTANQRKHYHESGVGEGILKAYKELGISREDLFLQTKFTFARGQDHRKPYNENDPYYHQVRSSFESSLKHLHTDYLDSYILHGPFSGEGITIEDKEVWKEMEKLHREGLVKNIGVSNVNLEQLKSLYQFAEIKPRYAQIRCFAIRYWEKEIRDFCNEHSIIFEGFSLLTANRDFLGGVVSNLNDRNVPKLDFQSENNNSQLSKILNNTGKTVAQVIFKFCLQKNMLPITGTRSIEHMKLNLDLDDFTLTHDQLHIIENIAFIK